MPPDPDRYVEAVKKGHTTAFDAMTQAHAQEIIVHEFLTCVESVLKEALRVADGRVEELYPDERGMFELYASWDYHNQGRRKTSEQLVNEAKEDDE